MSLLVIGTNISKRSVSVRVDEPDEGGGTARKLQMGGASGQKRRLPCELEEQGAHPSVLLLPGAPIHKRYACI